MAEDWRKRWEERLAGLPPVEVVVPVHLNGTGTRYEALLLTPDEFLPGGGSGDPEDFIDWLAKVEKVLGKPTPDGEWVPVVGPGQEHWDDGNWSVDLDPVQKYSWTGYGALTESDGDVREPLDLGALRCGGGGGLPEGWDLPWTDSGGDDEDE